MLTPLFKKPKFASTVGSMLTVVFGCLSLFTVLMNDFPQPLVWLLCLLSPSAFSIGIAQVTHTNTPGRVLTWSYLLLDQPQMEDGGPDTACLWLHQQLHSVINNEAACSSTCGDVGVL